MRLLWRHAEPAEPVSVLRLRPAVPQDAGTAHRRTMVRAMLPSAVMILGLIGCAARPVLSAPLAPSLPTECPVHVLMGYEQAGKFIDINRFPWWGPRFPCE